MVRTSLERVEEMLVLNLQKLLDKNKPNDPGLSYQNKTLVQNNCHVKTMAWAGP